MRTPYLSEKGDGEIGFEECLLAVHRARHLGEPGSLSEAIDLVEAELNAMRKHG